MGRLQRNSSNLILLISVAMIATVSPGCQKSGGGGSGGGFKANGAPATSANPPSGCAYSTPAPTYGVGVAIAANAVDCYAGDHPTSFSISPDLSADTGLSFSTTTGTISGTPSSVVTAKAYTVTVSNSGGSTTANITVTVTAGLFVSCAQSTIVQSGSTSCSAAGGTGTISWSVVDKTSTPGGSMSAATGTSSNYSGASGTGVVTVQVTDGASHQASFDITVNADLSASCTQTTIMATDADSCSATGGVGSVTWSVSGTPGGAINASGNYTGSTASGSETITATDSQGHTSNVTVTVNPALAMSGCTPSTIMVGDSSTCTATGGVGAITWSNSGTPGGSMTGNSYSGSGSSGSETITATDSRGHSVNTTVTVNPALQMSCANATITIANSDSCTASGGVGTLNWTVVDKVIHPHGSMNNPTGLSSTYSAATGPGAVTVKVTDSASSPHVASTDITINPNLSVSCSPSSVSIGGSSTCTASGGAGAISWSVSGTPGGSAPGGAYSGSTQGGIETITATDFLSNQASATVNVSACVHGSQPFYFTGASQSFIVPANCNSMTISAWGGGGGGAGGTSGGGGAFSKNTVSVTPGSTLTVIVGGAGHAPGGACCNFGIHGYPNGMDGEADDCSSTWPGGGGGGSSYVKDGTNFLVEAAGGAGGPSTPGAGQPGQGVNGTCTPHGGQLAQVFGGGGGYCVPVSPDYSAGNSFGDPALLQSGSGTAAGNGSAAPCSDTCGKGGTGLTGNGTDGVILIEY